jgi:hypothetical protein
MNKYFIIFIFAIIVSSELQSQEITVTTDTSNSAPSQWKYSYFDINQYNQRTVFKAGIFAGQFNRNLADIAEQPFNLISIEHKLSKKFSLEGTLYLFENRKYISAKSRYYFAKSAQDPNNISGNYFGVEIAKKLTRLGSGFYYDYDGYLGNEKTLIILFGSQFKKGQYGYSDISFYLNRQFGFRTSTNLGVKATVGLAWGRTKESGNEDRSILKNEFVKSDKMMLSAENLNGSFGKYFKYGTASFSGEFYLFKGFTLNTNLIIGASFQSFASFQSSESSYFDVKSIEYSTQIRKYLFRQALLKQGKPIQSFSGAYLAVGLNKLLSHSNINYNFSNGENGKVSFNGTEKIAPHFGLGYQDKLNDKFFFNIFGDYYPYTRNHLLTNEKGPDSFLIGAKVGIFWAR